MNTSKNSSFHSNVSNCIICLDEVRCRGKLSVCKHWFCFGCILEWSKNTNTCPVCKTRFRSISKVHLSPLKSPPTKVRVPDKDQRVWNDDDDDGVTEEMLYDIQNEIREDMDDDYEPPTHWSIASNMQYQDDLDEYDLEDSFIDDSNLTQPSSHTPERFLLTQEFIQQALATRNSPYMLRRRSGRRSTDTRGNDVMLDIYALNDIEEDTVFEDINSDESCDSSSTDSSLSDTDEEDDESNTRTSTRTRSQAPRRNTRSQTSRRSTRSQTTRSTRSQVPTRNTRSQALRRSTRSQVPTRNTRSQALRRSTRSKDPNRNIRTQALQRSIRFQARQQQEQTRNQRQREDQLISQNIQETGSSGWLNTRSTNERATSASAPRPIAQTANHNSSPRQTGRDSAESSHGHVRSEHELRTRNDDDTYDSDKSGKSPMRPSATRVKEDKKSSPKKSRFSRIRVPSSSESELSDTVVLSPTKYSVQQRSTGNDNSNSAVQRNMELPLPSSSHAIEDDDPACNPSEVKTWKRIRNGKKGKGKENKPLSRSLFSQSPSVRSDGIEDDDPTCNPSEMKTWKRITNGKKGKGKENKPLSCSLFSQSPSVRSTDDPEFIPNLSDELPSKRSRLDSVSNKNVCEGRELFSAATRLTRSGVRRLENDSHFVDVYAKCSASSSQSRLDPSGVKHRYVLRKHIKGNQNSSDDYDDYDSDSDVEHTGKTTRIRATVRMPRDYKDDSTEDDSTDEDEKKSRNKGIRRNIMVNRAHDYKDDATDDDDDDDERKSIKNKKRNIMVNRAHDYKDDATDDDDDERQSRNKEKTRNITKNMSNDDDEKHVGKRKRKGTTCTLNMLHKCRDSTDDDDDDDDYIMDNEPLNIIKPTPQPNKKRSLFTRRQHRTINEQFDDPSNEQDHPRYGRFFQTQPQLPKPSSKFELSDCDNEKNVKKRSVPCRGIQLIKEEVSNDDFTPGSIDSSSHMNRSYSSNKPTVTRTRRRIKVYDSDSD